MGKEETWLARPMLGIEALSLQGFPASCLRNVALAESFSNVQLLAIAGNVFSISAFAAVYMSALAELPDPVATDHDRTEDNLQAILVLMSDA